MKQPSLELDLDAVRHNVRAWRSFLSGRELWAVVKLDAYGLGLVPVARACLDAGAQRLCVVDMEEARALRVAGIDAPIVNVWATPPDVLTEALELRVVPSVEHEHAAQVLSQLATRSGVSANVHVALDTGTGWSGLPVHNVERFAQNVRSLPSLNWEGCWTHIAGRESLESQTAAFESAALILKRAGLGVAATHVASTGPAAWGAPGSAVRIGIGLYGSTMGESPPDLRLKTAISVKASVVGIKRFAAATPLGYGGKYVAQPGEAIATLRIGYGDGLPKSLSGRGEVLLGGSRCRIVGEIGMNFTMAALPSDSVIDLDEEGTFMTDHDGFHLDEVAGAANTIPHALVTGLCAGMRQHSSTLSPYTEY